jgi:transcriptional regulator with XRE-family HTH domain
MLEYDRRKLGQYLKEVREGASYTQADVSQRLGYTSPQFISNIERGISVVPLKTLARMVSIYKVRPEPVVRIILESQRRLLKEKLTRSKYPFEIASLNRADLGPARGETPDIYQICIESLFASNVPTCRDF